MTSQGSAHGRSAEPSSKAISSRPSLLRELRGLSLPEALDLVALIARVRPDRLELCYRLSHGAVETPVAFIYPKRRVVEIEAVDQPTFKSSYAATSSYPANYSYTLDH